MGPPGPSPSPTSRRAMDARPPAPKNGPLDTLQTSPRHLMDASPGLGEQLHAEVLALLPLGPQRPLDARLHLRHDEGLLLETRVPGSKGRRLSDGLFTFRVNLMAWASPRDPCSRVKRPTA